MTLVTAAFSFGRDHDLLRVFEEIASPPLHLHDLRSDVDANRTWIAYSGEPQTVKGALLELCAAAFDRIDLERHAPEFPRLGALDLCSWVGEEEGAVQCAEAIADRFKLPVYLTHRNDAWFALREGGFGGLFERELRPDFGGPQVHEKLGVAAVWSRPFFLTSVAEVEEERADFLKSRARDIAQRRADGEAMFAGVEAVAYPAPSDACSRIVIEFADPDNAPPDPVLAWLDRRAGVAGLRVRSQEAIGAVRRVDLLETRGIPLRESQIVDL